MELSQLKVGEAFKRHTWEDDLLAVKCSKDVVGYIKFNDGRWEVVGQMSYERMRSDDFIFPYLTSRKEKALRKFIETDGTLQEYIRKADKGEQVMSKNVNYIGGKYDVVRVQYVEGSQGFYNFKIDVSHDVQEGDLVVVEASTGYGLARVAAVFNNEVKNADQIGKAKAWVVNVVDTTLHDERVKATEEHAYIIAQLEERQKSIEAINMYAMLAQIDPEAKALVERLQKITTGPQNDG